MTKKDRRDLIMLSHAYFDLFSNGRPSTAKLELWIKNYNDQEEDEKRLKNIIDKKR